MTKQILASKVFLKYAILLTLLAVFSLVLVANVKAGADENVSGWAWSENIGWVSFNNLNPPGDSEDYGVRVCIDNADTESFCDVTFYQLNPVTYPKKGRMLGYAWAGGGVDAVGQAAATIGWIGFGDYDGNGVVDNADEVIVASCPELPCEAAKVDLDGCVADICPVSGWARALSYNPGWDGWIKLDYGIQLNESPAPDEFEGWSWGTDAIGWLSFNCKDCAGNPDCSCSNNFPACTSTPVAGACGNCGTDCFSDYQVTLNLHQPPVAAIGCEIIDCRGPGCLCNGSWITYHANSDYKLWNMSTLPELGTKYYSTWYYDGTQIGFSNCEDVGGVAPTCHIENIAGIPSALSPYTLRLVVEDEYGVSSTATQLVTVRKDVEIKFKCSLDDGVTWQDCTSITPLMGQTIHFLDESIPSDGATSINKWVWEKGYIDGFGAFVSSGQFASTSIASSTLTPTINAVRLTARDDTSPDSSGPYSTTEGRSASGSETINVTLPLPEYREVAPVSFRDSFLARLVNISARF